MGKCAKPFKFRFGISRNFHIWFGQCQRWAQGLYGCIGIDLTAQDDLSVVFLIIYDMVLTSHHPLNYGEKKHRIPKGLAKLNTQRQQEFQLPEDNTQQSNISISHHKTGSILSDYNNIQNLSVSSQKAPTKSRANVVSFATYKWMESKANAAVSRAQRAEESAKLYRTKLYNANRCVAQATNIVACCKQESTDLSESIDIVEYLTHIIIIKYSIQYIIVSGRQYCMAWETPSEVFGERF